MGAGRKQAVRRASRRARYAEQLAAARTRSNARGDSALGLERSHPPNRLWIAVGVTLAAVFIVTLDLFLVYGQIEIARVMTTGRSAQATVTAVDCSRGAKSSTGDVTVTFTDISGSSYTVHHSSDTFNCFDQYHAGDVIAIRYAPSDPTKLLTQAEIDSLPWALVLYGLCDALFVISPPVLLVVSLRMRVFPWTVR